jgi:DNA-binding NarL/FixJ family response regulator
MNEPSIFEQLARRSGANAYLSKSQSIDEILSALNFALDNPQSFSSLLHNPSHETIRLTPREIDLLHLIAKGASNAEISSTLFISTSTVKTHISSIFRKLQCTNRTAAIVKARERGLLL